MIKTYGAFKSVLASGKASFFRYPIILSNNQVKLRPLKIEDKSAFAKFPTYATIWKYFATKMYQEQDMNNFIDEAIEQQKLNLRYHFAIEDQKTGAIVGSTAFGNYSPKDSRIEIGWSWVEPSSQGSGINQNAKFCLLDFAFGCLEMERVEFKTDVFNERARGALNKIGASEEGVLRSHTLMPDGRRRDTVYYSILKDEWEEVRLKMFNNYTSEITILTGDCDSLSGPLYENC
jgi:RimJ/RimL family protein N-acetyltransferase